MLPRDFRRDARNATKEKNRVLHATLPLVSIGEIIEQLQMNRTHKMHFFKVDHMQVYLLQ